MNNNTSCLQQSKKYQSLKTDCFLSALNSQRTIFKGSLIGYEDTTNEVFPLLQKNILLFVSIPQFRLKQECLWYSWLQTTNTMCVDLPYKHCSNQLQEIKLHDTFIAYNYFEDCAQLQKKLRFKFYLYWTRSQNKCKR